MLIKDDRPLSPLNGEANRIPSPGDTVCISPGYYSGTLIKRIAGTQTAPIIITNCGGQVVFRDEVPINSSRHISFLGNGHSDTLCGLKIMGTQEEEAEFISTYGIGFQIKSQPALDIAAKSRDIEIAWMEISNPIAARAPGIHFVTKTLTDDDGNYIAQFDLENADEIFVQTGTYIHHNFIHDNIVTNNGGDGIQVGCSRKDTYNNYVYDAGYNPFNNRRHTKRNSAWGKVPLIFTTTMLTTAQRIVFGPLAVQIMTAAMFHYGFITMYLKSVSKPLALRVRWCYCRVTKYRSS